MTVRRSGDGGGSWQIRTLVDPGAAGYSSLQPTGDTAAPAKPATAATAATTATTTTTADDDSIWIMYEQSDRPANSFGHVAAAGVIGALTVLDPDRLVLRLLPGVLRVPAVAL